jgi:hypothetical protein
MLLIEKLEGMSDLLIINFIKGDYYAYSRKKSYQF